MSDQQGPLESRLLTLERRQDRIDTLLADLRRRSIAVSQGIWGAWSDYAPPAEPEAPTTTDDFSDICPSIPLALTLVDSYYGPCPLNYNEATRTWTGCKLISYPITPLCPAVASTPIFYTLNGSNLTARWTLQVAWVGRVTIPAGNICPVNGATCATKPTYSKGTTGALNCQGTTTWSFSGGNQNSIYPNGANGVLTIDLSAEAPA